MEEAKETTAKASEEAEEAAADTSEEAKKAAGSSKKSETAADASEEGTASSSSQSAVSQNSEYIIPDSSTRLLTAADLNGLSKNELRLARNEIFARYGRRFKDQELQE